MKKIKFVAFLFVLAGFLYTNITISYAEEVQSKVTGSLIESDITQDSVVTNEENSGRDSSLNDVIFPQTGDKTRDLWAYAGYGIIMIVLAISYYKWFVVARSEGGGGQ